MHREACTQFKVLISLSVAKMCIGFHLCPTWPALLLLNLVYIWTLLSELSIRASYVSRALFRSACRLPKKCVEFWSSITILFFIVSGFSSTSSYQTGGQPLSAVRICLGTSPWGRAVTTRGTPDMERLATAV
jgi:hypothetical protein